MKTRLAARLWALSLLSATLAAWPLPTAAQTTNKPAADKKNLAAAETKDPGAVDKKAKPGPFHGKLAAVDKIAKTITVGKRTFQITSATKIKKGDKPALLEDGVVGEETSGYVKPTDDGKLVAMTVNFGPKTGPKPMEKKQEAAPAARP